MIVLPRDAWELADCYAHAFGDDMGKRVLRDLEQESGMFDDFLSNGPIDTHRLTAGLGARKLYLHIRRQLHVAGETDRRMPVVTGATDALGDPVRQEP